MDVEIINVIAQQGGALGLGLFAMWMLNRTWKLRLEETKRYAEELKQMNCEMREAIDRNTEAWITMMERVKRN